MVLISKPTHLVTAPVKIPKLIPLEPVDSKAAKTPAFEVREIPCKGMGMIATHKLYPGDLILAEKPILKVPEDVFEDVESCEEFIEKEMNKLSSEDRELFLGLSDKRVKESEDFFDPTPYCGIFYTNAMSYGDEAVLCPVMARANHSCRANAEFVSREDLGEQHLVANYIINAGDEISINYMSMLEEGTDVRDTRQSYLRELYGFQCTCAACTLQDQELLDDELLRENIKELQAAGEDNLEVNELQWLISCVYLIQGKHSYILNLILKLYRSAPVGSYRMVEYAVNGFTIAVNLYGVGSKQAREWKERLDFQKSINLMLKFDEILPGTIF